MAIRVHVIRFSFFNFKTKNKKQIFICFLILNLGLKPCFFCRLKKYITPQTLSKFFCYKLKLISNFIFKVSCQMKKHIVMRFSFQFSIINGKMKIEIRAFEIVLTDHLPSRWYGLIGNHIAISLIYEKRALIYFNQLLTFNNILSCR